MTTKPFNTDREDFTFEMNYSIEQAQKKLDRLITLRGANRRQAARTGYIRPGPVYPAMKDITEANSELQRLRNLEEKKRLEWARWKAENGVHIDTDNATRS